MTTFSLPLQVCRMLLDFIAIDYSVVYTLKCSPIVNNDVDMTFTWIWLERHDSVRIYCSSHSLCGVLELTGFFWVGFLVHKYYTDYLFFKICSDWLSQNNDWPICLNCSYWCVAIVSLSYILWCIIIIAYIIIICIISYKLFCRFKIFWLNLIWFLTWIIVFNNQMSLPIYK